MFLAAGFGGSTSALSFTLYELAEHQDVQKKLQEEVDGVLGQHDDQITYNNLQEMQYLDKVLNGTSIKLNRGAKMGDPYFPPV